MIKKIYYKSPLPIHTITDELIKIINDDTVIICIGTDKCIGDSLGPFVGTFLKNSLLPLPIYGTISNPIHALNINKNLYNIKDSHPTSKIIGIDACLGEIHYIGEIHIRDSTLFPGKGVGKSLPTVGDYSIVGIVDSNKNSAYFSSRSIRLSLVIDMAKTITDGIVNSYLYLNKKNFYTY